MADTTWRWKRDTARMPKTAILEATDPNGDVAEFVVCAPAECVQVNVPHGQWPTFSWTEWARMAKEIENKIEEYR